ncbi:unnamed protein product [Bursaphelenchus xylophilus]|uniref:(pine wood nematode) hypothetical protein n=1 Tax=Bursaphelenchus xylophilus TaxID=6326 RepID=A0A1I7RUR2_BURXY|nr:unnamed protein product [Bursaphelenchus xylophilus]CAG9114343.1 unnamed protein product [Bursaphelenchus xylophilus]
MPGPAGRGCERGARKAEKVIPNIIPVARGDGMHAIRQPNYILPRGTRATRLAVRPFIAALCWANEGPRTGGWLLSEGGRIFTVIGCDGG